MLSLTFWGFLCYIRFWSNLPFWSNLQVWVRFEIWNRKIDFYIFLEQSTVLKQSIAVQSTDRHSICIRQNGVILTTRSDFRLWASSFFRSFEIGRCKSRGPFPWIHDPSGVLISQNKPTWPSGRRVKLFPWQISEYYNSVSI